MTPLVLFYLGVQPDHAGRFLTDIQSWNDAQLEAVHDYIQWLFPLPEPSPVNPLAPTLDPETIAKFRADPKLQIALRNSLHRMLRFYGVEDAAFNGNTYRWLTPGNHNHLRITRILRSTRLLGLENESAAFFDALKALYATPQGSSNISRTTYSYWLSASQPEAALRMEHHSR